ncbi:DUF721 domain-containing protein [Nesterenkonia massiliensis]|uniref:DUF721 domain-containing protein n=1 Tax=Nesterenkonia massiliensis TaxID=1232429 RepID=UPI002D2194B9|nr:DciA family protein [Nesterenkonia massiliensis]
MSSESERDAVLPGDSPSGEALRRDGEQSVARRERGGVSPSAEPLRRDGEQSVARRERGGVSPPAEQPEEIDAATALFNRFRRAAEERGERRLKRPVAGSSLSADPRATARAEERRRRGGQEADLRDPRPLGGVVKGLINTRGWTAPVAVGSVISRWDQLVGAAIAEHCKPQSFDAGVVVVLCDSTAWATNLKLMKPKLMEVFDRELGPGIVSEIEIRGPQAPSWKKGRLSVRGRGPRDTYG